MDKHTATNYTLTQLKAGKTREEVVDELSQILKAPPAAIDRFVDQVISNNPKDVEPSSEKSVIHDRVESFPIQAEEPLAEPPFSNQNSDLPPGLAALVNERMGVLVAINEESVERAHAHKPPGKKEITLPQQAEFETPVAQDGDKVDLEMFGEFVFQQLKKQHRHNDIVEAVCNQTGWHWNKSQRFVARIQTKRHKELQTGKNRVIVVIGIGIILTGLIMAINGASAIVYYAQLASQVKTNPEILFNISPQSAFFTLITVVTGLGMVIGGSYGIARALSNR